MAVLVTSEVPGGDAKQDAAIVESLGLTQNPPKGARMRMAGPTEGGWRIVSLWDSRELFEAFVAERLAPALKDAGRPQPNFEFWTVERVDVMA